jgi:dienelactone hydrolase
VQAAVRGALSAPIGWRHATIVIYMVLAVSLGWRSNLALVALAASVLSIWPQLLTDFWRRKYEWAMGLLSIGVIVSTYFLVNDLAAGFTGEGPAPNMPSGFLLGRYNKGSLWEPKLIQYGLYVPPQLKNGKGPFPLVVFLHGVKEGNERVIFLEGVARSAANAFGPEKPNGPFPYVAFFPIDPAKLWLAGSVGVEDTMLTLDYVIEKHHIDPSRIYLTGHSVGGNGVWRLAEAYPNKWAALAPLSASTGPRIEKVRQFPIWIFHAARDKAAPVESDRLLFEQLKQAKADVRYTELPTEAHVIQGQVYDSKELYDWFATKKRND